MAARRSSEETRARILAAADALFYAHGTRATGVDAVAERAGVTVRTLYAKFGSKEGLIDAYLAGRDAAILRALDRAAGEGGAEERLGRVFAALAASGDYRGCPFARTLAEEMSGSAAETARARARAHKHGVEAWLRRLIGAERPGSGAVAAQLAILIEGTVSQLMVHGDAGYARRAGDAALQIYRAWTGRARDQ